MVRIECVVDVMDINGDKNSREIQFLCAKSNQSSHIKERERISFVRFATLNHCN